jgi:hypothetical protein
MVMANYGQPFNLTELSVLLRSRVPGLQNVIFQTVAGTVPANKVLSSTQIKEKINQADLTVNMYAV